MLILNVIVVMANAGIHTNVIGENPSDSKSIFHNKSVSNPDQNFT